MKTFLAIYVGSTESMQIWRNLDEVTRKSREQQGFKDWTAWGAKYNAAVVDAGGPLGKTKQIDKKGIADISNNIAAYVVVRAESHQAAAEMFLHHPHFMAFPGDGIEIMECLPIPQLK